MINKWSLEEEKYLMNNWGQANIKIIMEALNRTEESIIRKAQRLRLSKDPNNYIKKRWSAEEERIINEYYQLKPVSELLELLPGRTRDSIIKKAKQLGINSENRYWSEDETTYLEEKWGVVPVENIAKKLSRTKSAVLLKAYKIGLREQVLANGEYLTPKDVASILAVATRTVYSWMERDYLKYRRLKVNSVKKYQITIINFKLFLETNKEKWDARIADVNFIKSCFIAGWDRGSSELPEWLMRKIELDKRKKSPMSRKQWTVKEEINLKSMIDKGITCRQIAVLLNRSFYSVQGKISSKRQSQFQGSFKLAANAQKRNQISSAR